MASFIRTIKMQKQKDCKPSAIEENFTKMPTPSTPRSSSQSRYLFRNCELVHDVEIVNKVGDLGTPTAGVPVAASLPTTVDPDKVDDINDDDFDDDDDGDDDYVPASRASKVRTSSPLALGHALSLTGKRPAKARMRRTRKGPRRYGRPRSQRPRFLADEFDNANEEDVEQRIKDHEDVNVFKDALNWAFCCARCTCSDDVKKEYLKRGLDVGSNIQFMESAHGGEHLQYHRPCCHRHRLGDYWEPPLMKAQREAIEGKNKKKSRDYNVVSLNKIRERCVAADRKDTKLQNDSNTAAPDSMAWSSQEYSSNARKFSVLKKKNEMERGTTAHHGITVLECFGGIGSLTLTLKRLGIKIDTVIFVEYDVVARMVYKFRHDPSFNRDLPKDGVKYFYINTFADLDRDFEDVMNQYGPFDLVAGGPPCLDFTGVNASRKGLSGKSGHLMLKFSELIRRMQKHEKQKEHPLFFLVENVTLTGNDLKQVSNVLDVSPIPLQSSCFSPCTRDRMYWINYPVNCHRYADKCSAKLSAGLCLEDGFQLAQEIVNPGSQGLKTFTFMASLTRLDDYRMLVYRRNPENIYTERPMTANERGDMMGFPVEYATTPLNHVFRHYLEGIRNDQWFGHVPEEYNSLSEVLMCVSSYWNDQNDIIDKVELVPRVYSDKFSACDLSYFDEEAYGKRLYGNAWNIPTIVYLLEPLKEIFERQEYEGFDYKYQWEIE